jgi:hypothetical protein
MRQAGAICAVLWGSMWRCYMGERRARLGCLAGRMQMQSRMWRMGWDGMWREHTILAEQLSQRGVRGNRYWSDRHADGNTQAVALLSVVAEAVRPPKANRITCNPPGLATDETEALLDPSSTRLREQKRWRRSAPSRVRRGTETNAPLRPLVRGLKLSAAHAYLDVSLAPPTVPQSECSHTDDSP